MRSPKDLNRRADSILARAAEHPRTVPTGRSSSTMTARVNGLTLWECVWMARTLWSI